MCFILDHDAMQLLPGPGCEEAGYHKFRASRDVIKCDEVLESSRRYPWSSRGDGGLLRYRVHESPLEHVQAHVQGSTCITQRRCLQR